MRTALVVFTAVVALAALLVFFQLRDEAGMKPMDSSSGPAETSNPDALPDPVTAQQTDSDAALTGTGLEIGLQDLSRLAAGDSFSLTIPNESRTLTASVGWAETTIAGSRVIQGQLYDPLQQTPEGIQAYPFTFTVGEVFTFGSIQTSLDRYQLEVRDGVGRIFSSADLKAVDHSTPDYVIPDKIQLEPADNQEQ